MQPRTAGFGESLPLGLTEAKYAFAKPYTSLPFLLLLMLVLGSCGDDAGKGGAAAGDRQAARAVPVRTAVAKQEVLVFYDSYPGTVQPLEEVEVRPQAVGYITGVHFRDGATVQRGQRLYTIDTRRYTADVAQADSRTSSAEANLALAQRDVERYRRLAEAEAIATQTLDRAEAQLEVARQEVAAAQAGKQSANAQLDYATVTAPISGVTSLVSVKQGAQVSPGQPLLTTVSQVAPIGVDFALPQALISEVSALESKSLAQLDSTFRLVLPGGEVYGEFGSVYALDRAVDSRTGNLAVRLRFANADGQLRAGMNVEVEVLNQRSGEVLLVPRPAIGEQMGEKYVFVRRDSIVLRQQVTTGRQVGANIVIASGIAAGDEVVVEGVKAMRDSVKVAVQPARRDTSAL